MEKTYHLDLKTLLEYLQGKSAVLRTTIRVPQSRQKCQGYIFVIGNTAHYYILNQDSALILADEKAAALLNARAEWQVRIGSAQNIGQDLRLFTQQYTLPSAMPSPPMARAAPRQKRTLDLSSLQRFSYGQSLILRSVFALVNGERTIEQIKSQLSLSAKSVEEALAVLRSLDVIE